MSAAAQTAMSKPSLSITRVAALVVLAIFVLVVVYFVKTREWQQAANVRMPAMLEQFGFNSTTPMQLDPQYTDADGDLVPDAPKDPSRLVTPDKLVFCFLTSDTADTEQ